MSGIDKRKHAMDSKLSYDSELKFKITNRRNRLLGEWIAQELGHTGETAEAYAKSVVLSDFQAPGDDDVIDKVMSDLQAAGHPLPEPELRQRMAAFMDDAQQQIQDAA